MERLFSGGERVWTFSQSRRCRLIKPDCLTLVSWNKLHVFSCSFRKPPHKRADGKEMAQEENFLPKYQRVKDLCQKAEYQTPCQQPGQVPDLRSY